MNFSKRFTAFGQGMRPYKMSKLAESKKAILVNMFQEPTGKNKKLFFVGRYWIPKKALLSINNSHKFDVYQIADWWAPNYRARLSDKWNFGNHIASKAKQWLNCKEESNTPNRSLCVDEIHEYTSGLIWSEPWCAEFAWMIIDLSCQDWQVDNPLPKTASTRQMVNLAPSRGLTVDKNPAVGSVFFKPRGDNPALGHVGIVFNPQGDGTIATIEGNYQNEVAIVTRTPDKNYRFIHTEKIAEGQNLIAGAKSWVKGVNPLVLGVSVLGVAISGILAINQLSK